MHLRRGFAPSVATGKSLSVYSPSFTFWFWAVLAAL